MDNFFGKKMSKMEQKNFSEIYKFFRKLQFLLKITIFVENYNIFRKLQVFVFTKTFYDYSIEGGGLSQMRLPILKSGFRSYGTPTLKLSARICENQPSS